MRRKFYIVLALLLAACFALAACGGGIEQPAPVESEPAAVEPEPAAPEPEPAAPEPAGEVFEFNLQNHDAPTGATAMFLDAWAEEVNKASNGQIVIHCFHGGSMGGPGDSYNMVADGTVDIAWGLPSFTPGLFPNTDVIALPFIGVKTSLQASYAIWELYDSTDFLKEEWSNVHMILLHTNCDAPLITNTKVEKADDIRGMNMRVNGGPPTEWATLAGANPMNMGIGDVYSAMERGVVDGVTSTGWDVVSAFRFYEQGQYFLDYSIHVNPYFLVMNNDSYNSLPDDLKAVIDQYSGYGALEVVGTRWADVKADVFDKIAESGGEIYKLDDAEQAIFNEYGVQAREKWMADTNDRGTDAEALVAKAMELLDKHKDK